MDRQQGRRAPIQRSFAQTLPRHPYRVSRLTSLLSATLAAFSLSAVPVAAQSGTPPTGTVVVGNVICFRIRVPDRQQTIQQRVDHIQEMAAKHLGGGPLRFTIRPVGARRHIDVNGEFLVAVTAEDAAATGYKTAAALAPIWRDALARGFRRTRARPAPPAVTEPEGSR